MKAMKIFVLAALLAAAGRVTGADERVRAGEIAAEARRRIEAAGEN